VKTALITAGGRGTRFKEESGGIRKQLCTPEPDENDEVLLDRIIRQCIERGIKPVLLVNHNDPIVEHNFVQSVEIKEDHEGCKSWVESLNASQDLWPDEGCLLVLLGDVWYSDDLFDRMEALADQEVIRFFGRQSGSGLTGSGAGEVWSITCAQQKYQLLRDGMEEALDDALADPVGPGRPSWMVGSPWQVYRSIVGVPLNVHAIGFCPTWVEWEDWTEDFDEWEQLVTWRKQRARRWVGGEG